MRDIPEDKDARTTWYHDAFFSIPRPDDWRETLFASLEINGTTYDIILHMNCNAMRPLDTAFFTCFNKEYPIIPISQIQTDVANRLQEQENKLTP
jgi:hypothetical protein